ncbi:MAG: DUF309 domain-containing protein [Cyanobacterium sp. T60_A2020_053]|nr:DUF309 domain-containing protein [Cyanobacterium sp. T60_A2020_053]
MSLQEAVKQFNEREFYACHDTLEALWMEASEPDKTFYQGVLQVAVGCYHLSHNNWRGALVLWGEGIRKLVDYEPSYYDLDITTLTDCTYQLLEHLQQIDPTQTQHFYHQLLTNDFSLSLPSLGRVIN